MSKDKIVTCLVVTDSTVKIAEFRETKDFYISFDLEKQKHRKHESCNVRKNGSYDSVAVSVHRHCSNKIYLLNSKFASSDLVIEKLGKDLLNIDHPNKEYIEKRYRELKFIEATNIALREMVSRLNGNYEAYLSINDRLNLGVKHEQE